MVVKSLKDAEIQINRLEERLRKLEGGGVTTPSTSGGTTVVENITNVTQVINKVLDSETTPDENIIFHKLEHRFNHIVKFEEVVLRELSIVAPTYPAVIDFFSLDYDGTSLKLKTALSGSYLEIDKAVPFGTFPVEMRHQMHLIPITHNVNTLGESGKSYKEAFIGILNLLTALAVNMGGTGATNVAGAQTNLNVYDKTQVYTKSETITEITNAIAAALTNYYTKSEVDTLLAAKASAGVYPVSMDAVGGHNHAGAVAVDGGHTPTGSVTIT